MSSDRRTRVAAFPHARAPVPGPASPHENDGALLELVVATQREITAAGSEVDAATQLVLRRSRAPCGPDGAPLSERHGQAVELLSMLLSAAVGRAHDPLTGLPNRTLFRQRIQQAAATAAPGGGFAVVIIDLDLFKEINDSMGHHAGDALLVEAARRIEGALRPSDTVARIGGDEFGLVLDAPTGAAGLETTLELVREAIEAPIAFRDVPLTISGTMGAAAFPGHGRERFSATPTRRSSPPGAPICRSPSTTRPRAAATGAD